MVLARHISFFFFKCVSLLWTKVNAPGHIRVTSPPRLGFVSSFETCCKTDANHRKLHWLACFERSFGPRSSHASVTDFSHCSFLEHVLCVRGNIAATPSRQGHCNQPKPIGLQRGSKQNKVVGSSSYNKTVKAAERQGQARSKAGASQEQGRSKAGARQEQGPPYSNKTSRTKPQRCCGKCCEKTNQTWFWGQERGPKRGPNEV